MMRYSGVGLMVVFCFSSISGCGIFRECVRYEYRTVQKCLRMESNGHCAHYGSESKQVCVERAPKASKLWLEPTTDAERSVATVQSQPQLAKTDEVVDSVSK